MRDDKFTDGRAKRQTHQSFDNYLSKRIQSWIEQRYYAKIDASTRLERLLYDPAFITKPLGHSSLFADHGIVHARDVAREVLQVLDCVNGVLFPARDLLRLEFMKGFSVQLAYIHDIGLCDLSAFGRKMHAYTVAQKVLSPEFDDLLQAIWDENAGNIPWILTKLPSLKQDPRLVLREMLALAVCHSKSAIPVEVLCDPQKLRKSVQRCAVIDLHILFDNLRKFRSMKKTSAGIVKATYPLESDELDAYLSPERTASLSLYYEDFSSDGFRWLIDEDSSTRELVKDVSDSLRALRCADALRQRGTTLKTSGNYEIFVDRNTGNAVFALRRKDQELILVEMPDPISAGEANLASCEITPDGDLRASFHRGTFPDRETLQRAASNAALVLNDIQGDAIESFQRVQPPRGCQKDWQKDANEMQILLENVADNPDFASLVQRQLQQSFPDIQNPVRVVPSLSDVSKLERRIYLDGKDLEWDDERKHEALNRIAKSGHKTNPIDPRLAFRDVKLIKAQAGFTLIEEGTLPGFVYIPLTGCLEIIPLGGYPAFLIQPWMPLGITGVIRGSIRNATVVIVEDAELLMIPQDIYLEHWHQTYNLSEFIQWMEDERARQAAESSEASSNKLNQVASQNESDWIEK